MNIKPLVKDEVDDQFLFNEVIESINSTLHCNTASNGKIALEKLIATIFLPNKKSPVPWNLLIEQYPVQLPLGRLIGENKM